MHVTPDRADSTQNWREFRDSRQQPEQPSNQPPLTNLRLDTKIQVKVLMPGLFLIDKI